MKKVMGFIASRVQSFKAAFSGIQDILTTEHNALIHILCTGIVLILCFWLRLPEIEFILIMIVISLVWISEAFNTVLEIVIDIVSPRYSDAARRAKDIAAAGVLFAAIISLVTALLILLPRTLDKLGL